jgi:sec-independent protein translocase protein TatA
VRLIPKGGHALKISLLFHTTMNQLLFLGNLGTGEIILIALLVLLLFGGKKIPELMRGIGKGVKSFKDGISDVESTIRKDIEEDKKD